MGPSIGLERRGLARSGVDAPSTTILAGHVGVEGSSTVLNSPTSATPVGRTPTVAGSSHRTIPTLPSSIHPGSNFHLKRFY